MSLQSTLANTLIEKALRTGDLEELQPWQFVRSEYQYGSSRWDFLLRIPVGSSSFGSQERDAGQRQEGLVS